MDSIVHPVDLAVTRLYCAAILVSAALTILAGARGWRRGVYVFKPLTTLLILLAALRAGDFADPPYRALVCVGLLFSLAGDVFLMLPRDRFVAGLVAFLIAHLCYIGAFGLRFSAAAPLILLALLGWGAVLMRILWPHLGKLRVPVVIYAAVLLVMAWTAVQRATDPIPGATLAAIGALLFVISDSALAIDRFARQFRGAQAVVLATYFAAQTLIALSVAPT